MQMTSQEYFTPSLQQVFDEIKQAAISIWNGYDSPYREGKLDRICDLKNIGDNAWYMVAMFDAQNQGRLLKIVSAETAEMIRRARGY